MNKLTLILDLDGVLITTPPWKSDEVDTDGYSKFNPQCCHNLNKLLAHADFEIWLSSSRRTMKSIEEFNQIFKNRTIIKPIKGFLPEYLDCKTRKDEIVKFIEAFNMTEFLIIDDDKSLNGLDEHHKENLILTALQKGFNEEKLELAIEKINKRTGG